jgi:hypothetical protein
MAGVRNKKGARVAQSTGQRRLRQAITETIATGGVIDKPIAGTPGDVDSYPESGHVRCN